MHEHHGTTIARTPSRLPTPPPLALDLSHAGRPVGWVRGDTIGFRGFASNVEAAHAAWVAYRAVALRLAKTDGRRPIPVDIGRLTLSAGDDGDDGDDRTVVMASGQPIATLLPPDPGSRSGDSFGFELRVPAPTYETRMRAMAYLAHRALRKSGVRWALWARDGQPRERRGDAVPAEAITSPRPPRAEARSARRAVDRGFALLCLALVVSVALIVPRNAVLPLGAMVLAALVLVGAIELPRRWWVRRVRAAEARAGLVTVDHATATRRAPAAEPQTRGGALRRPVAVAVTVTASVAALLLALVMPDHLAGPVGVLGLTGLLASRLLAPRPGIHEREEIEARREPDEGLTRA
ncbi:hypothetical protein J421_5278 (plasmid) [Gemmatirosa kalamazoonensis]|uniref:Uncharacterized protein n=1 Tax=Gemmatirosa kalamazoonensis TaxID=861299 RepID=W0RTA5_9BACT|nr:hypothetical protein [Gemmatirosa kalamazoonensis]AHG92813.1 hypothetical protein J421_5278 [Gemmatirosa kalamazoonensis]